MPDFPLIPSRCALLINDIEEKMLRPSSPFYAATAIEVAEKLLPLIDFCRTHDVPTLFSLIGIDDTRTKAMMRIEMPDDAVLLNLTFSKGRKFV